MRLFKQEQPKQPPYPQQHNLSLGVSRSVGAVGECLDLKKEKWCANVKRQLKIPDGGWGENQAKLIVQGSLRGGRVTLTEDKEGVWSNASKS